MLRLRLEPRLRLGVRLRLRLKLSRRRNELGKRRRINAGERGSAVPKLEQHE